MQQPFFDRLLNCHFPEEDNNYRTGRRSYCLIEVAFRHQLVTIIKVLMSRPDLDWTDVSAKIVGWGRFTNADAVVITGMIDLPKMQELLSSNGAGMEFFVDAVIERDRADLLQTMLNVQALSNRNMPVPVI